MIGCQVRVYLGWEGDWVKHQASRLISWSRGARLSALLAPKNGQSGGGWIWGRKNPDGGYGATDDPGWGKGLGRLKRTIQMWRSDQWKISRQGPKSAAGVDSRLDPYLWMILFEPCCLSGGVKRGDVITAHPIGNSVEKEKKKCCDCGSPAPG